MAGRGPAPSADKVRRNKEPESVALAADGQRRGPDLPAITDDEGNRIGWPPPTVSWWENWRTSAQAQVMGPTDWDYLLETAMLHARFWRGDASVAGELRLRVAKFGATPEDRMRLRMSIGEAPTAAKRGSKKAASVKAAEAGFQVIDGQASG